MTKLQKPAAVSFSLFIRHEYLFSYTNLLRLVKDESPSLAAGFASSEEISRVTDNELYEAVLGLHSIVRQISTVG